MVKAYDTFTKKSIEITCPTKFLKEYNLYNRPNRQTMIHFMNTTRLCLDRFVKDEYIDVVFKMYCLDDDVEYDCATAKGFLMQINEDIIKRNIHETNRLRSGGRTAIVFGEKTYVLYTNKDNISNYSLCSGYYKGSLLYDKNKKVQKLQRRLANNLRSRVKSAIRNKSNSTMELTGCSIEFLMDWLEKSFVDNMNWDNYGKWHVDHIIPCDFFDLTDEENQIKCFHYSNLQPLWATDNFKKGSKII